MEKFEPSIDFESKVKEETNNNLDDLKIDALPLSEWEKACILETVKGIESFSSLSSPVAIRYSSANYKERLAKWAIPDKIDINPKPDKDKEGNFTEHFAKAPEPIVITLGTKKFAMRLNLRGDPRITKYKIGKWSLSLETTSSLFKKITYTPEKLTKNIVKMREWKPDKEGQIDWFPWARVIKIS